MSTARGLSFEIRTWCLLCVLVTWVLLIVLYSLVGLLVKEAPVKEQIGRQGAGGSGMQFVHETNASEGGGTGSVLLRKAHPNIKVTDV